MKTPDFQSLIISVGVGFVFLVAGTCAPIYAQEGKHEQDARPEKQEQQQVRDQEKPQEQHQEKGQQEHQQQAKEQQQEKGQQEHQQQAKEQQQEKGQREHQQQAKEQQQEKQQQTQGLQKEQQKTQVQQKEQQTQSRQKQQPQQQPKALKKSAPQPSKPVQHIVQAEQKSVWQQHRAQNWQADHRTWQQRGGYSGYRIPMDNYHGHFGRNHFFRIYSLDMQIYGGYPRFQYNGYWFSVLDPWPESWSEGWYENDDVYITYSNDGYYLFNRSHPGVGIAVSVYVN